MQKQLPTYLLLLIALCLFTAPQAYSQGDSLSGSRSEGSISIDGVLDEPVWAKAAVYTEFVTVEPLTVEPAKYSTEVRMITNEKGIFIGFTNYQPASVKRVNRQFARDAEIQADRNVVSIDFDGTALAGYDFTVGSANSQQDGIVTPGDYSADWDGTWYSQTSAKGDYWYSEIHIPWAVAPMTNTGEGRKNIAVWFSRVVYNESLRFAFPNAYFSRTTFMEDWHSLEVDQVTGSTMDWFPYISHSSDLVDSAGGSGNERGDTNSGIDFIWRPNSSTQITGAINPDFGQVESDDLVVNFSAFETFVTEKRPFFTENQSLFGSSIPNGDRALYTRRIGAGLSGSGSGLVDIDLAGKLTRFGETTDLGLFVVKEDNADGSFGGDFLSTSIQRKVNGLTLGHRLTYVDRSEMGREAMVQVVDVRWQKTDRTTLRGQILHADLQQHANASNGQANINKQDFAGWASWSYAPSDDWYHKVYLSHYGDQFDMNDMGYMRRNDFNEFFASSRHDQLQYAPSSKVLSSSEILEYGYTENNAGDRLNLWAEWDKTWTFRSTRELSLEAGMAVAGWDDRITRGNGLLATSSRQWLETRYASPRGDKYSYNTRVNVEYSEIEKSTLSISYSPQLYLSETVTLGGRLSFKKMQEWLIWDFDSQQLAGYAADRYSADLRFDWYPSSRQEVRLKFQWVGIDAEIVDGYQLDARGNLLSSNVASSDFSVSDTALQVRYRYQLAPLSDIFLVYSRGGYYDNDNGDEGLSTLLKEGWNGLQVESVIAKIRYRF